MPATGGDNRVMARRRLPRLRGRDPAARRRHPVLAALADLDQAAFRTLRTRAHGPLPDAVMKALGGAGEWAGVWVATGIAAAALDRPRRGHWLAAASVGPAAIGINFAIKVAVGRKRPLLEEHPPLARAPTKLSFPSAHATSSLAAATALGRVAPGGRPLLYTLAAAICLSRPYLGMHYPSDVLAGAVLGTALGRAMPGLDGRVAAFPTASTSPPPAS
jgi:decaprenylphosphoryl-5-phosphoribose phosphatase